MKAVFIFWGKVIAGKKRGRTLGYPTANIHLHKKIPEGIYVSQVYIYSSIIPLSGVTFIGAAKTFNEIEVKAETYILDFDENIYGKWITIKLYKKLRNNKKFDSEIVLKKQIGEDIEACKKYLFSSS